MKQLNFVLALVASGVLVSSGVAAQQGPRPILYPNAHLSQVGETRAQKDITDCTNQAAGYVHQSSQPGQGARQVLGGALRGAALGTVGGAVMGNTGRGAAAGSVMGATRSAATNMKNRGSNNPQFQEYANACLEDKGYRVLRWG